MCIPKMRVVRMMWGRACGVSARLVMTAVTPPVKKPLRRPTVVEARAKTAGNPNLASSWPRRERRLVGAAGAAEAGFVSADMCLSMYVWVGVWRRYDAALRRM